MTSLERGRVPSPRSIAVKEVPLVDRAEEMNLLKEAVYRAVHGEGGLVFVHGEAGIGKTRLLRELGAYAQSRGVQVLYGRCPALFRMDGVPPYILWSEVIRDYLQTCSPEQLYKVIGFYPGELAKLAPELGQKLGSIPQSLPISPEHERDRLFEAVSQFVTNISREAPLLLVLDDLQWTDSSSLLLLHYLARGVYTAPVLFLGAYRTTDADSKLPLFPILIELNRERLLQSIPLKRMSLNDVSEMIKQILEQDDVPLEFCRMVYEKTRGNPFFAEEVIKSMTEEELIYREDNRWMIKEISKVEFPETVRSVIKSRIDRLDADCQNVLTLASFIGNDFTFEGMCAVTGFKEDKLLELMEKIDKTGLFRHRIVHKEDVCAFADIIVRDYVYEEVSPYKRKKLHRIVGRALEKLYAKEINKHSGELALHFLESGDKDKALDYFLKAGENATMIYANSEAASYFQSALRLLEEKEGELQEKAHVLENLGEVKRLVGEYDTCIKYWSDALLLRNQLHEKEEVSNLHRKMAKVLWDAMGETKKAEEHHDRALKILESEPESPELASLYEDMAHMYYRIGDMPKALARAEKALELAKRLNAYEVIASSYASLGTVFTFTGEKDVNTVLLEKGLEYLERALKIALDSGCVETALRAYNNLAVSLPKEENQRIMEYLEKGFELAKKTGNIYWISWIGTNLAEKHIGLGNVNKAVTLAEESVALDRKAGNLSYLSVSMDVLGLVYQVLGEWDKSERYYEEALGICQRLNEFQQLAYAYGVLGWFHFDKGEYIRAREHFEKAYEVLNKAGAKYSRVSLTEILPYFIWTYIELKEIEKAENLIDDPDKLALEAKDKGLIAIGHALKAMLFRAKKNWKESIEYFGRSLQEFEALNARQWNVYWFAKLVLCEYTRVYLERDQEGDKEKALSLLNQALDMFQKMGAKKDIEKVEARIAFVETGKVVSKPKPMEPASTGYAELDKLLYGGIPSNFTVVLTSPSCNERDLLVNSFLESGAKKGEVTFFVTIDPSAGKPLAEEFPSNFYLFVCNPEADAIIKDSPNVFKMKGVENLTDISIALTTAIRKLDATLKGLRRICLGPVSDVLLQHHAVETRRWLSALLTKLKSENFTTLAVVDPKMHPSEELHAVLGLFDGEINIYEKGAEKLLRINRMRDQEYSEDELLLTKKRAH